MYKDHVHSLDQIPDNSCYTAIFVYRYETNQLRPSKKDGSVLDCGLQK